MEEIHELEKTQIIDYTYIYVYLNILSHDGWETMETL